MVDKIKLKKIPKSFWLSLIFCVFSIFEVNIQNKRFEQKILGAKIQVKQNQQTVAYWEQIVKERPNYRDGWIHLAASYYKIGEKQKAKDAIKRAKELDPTNQTILNFEKFLEEHP